MLLTSSKNLFSTPTLKLRRIEINTRYGTIAMYLGQLSYASLLLVLHGTLVIHFSDVRRCTFLRRAFMCLVLLVQTKHGINRHVPNMDKLPIVYCYTRAVSDQLHPRYFGWLAKKFEGETSNLDYCSLVSRLIIFLYVSFYISVAYYEFNEPRSILKLTCCFFLVP